MAVLYDRIGPGYDTTRRADPHIAARLGGLPGLDPGDRCLDVGCGSGNYTLALAARGLRMTGLDISATMLAAAGAKARGVSAPSWCHAPAERMPFAAGAFAGAVAVLSIHHFADLGAALREVGRVLDATRGRFVIFTATRTQMRRYWLNRYFPGLMRRSTARMPSLATVRAALAAAGLGRVESEPFTVTPEIEDRFLYSGKHRPELYLDPAFRAGSSSFASLAEPGELAQGLARLERDIRSGRIREIIAAAEHPGGDYLFIRAARA